MTLFDDLKQSALLQHAQGDFPDWLLADVLEVADNPDCFAGKENLVETLVKQIREYDPYAGSGCFDTSFGVEDIRRTLRHLGS